MKEQCSERVYDSDPLDVTGHQCSRRATKDGKCGVHHPGAKKSRSDKSRKHFDRKWAMRNIQTLRNAALLLRRQRGLSALADRVDEAAARWAEEIA